MNPTKFQSPAFSPHSWAYLPAFFFLLAMGDASAQASFKSPSFASLEIKASPGSHLNFTLSGLPDPKIHGDTKGNLELQINWVLADQCGGSGIQYSEKVKIRSTTHSFKTSYVLSKHDDRKKLRLNVSYVKPTGEEENPAKGFLPASRECASLSIIK
jgi:hypothetical protein